MNKQTYKDLRKAIEERYQAEIAALEKLAHLFGMGSKPLQVAVKGPQEDQNELEVGEIDFDALRKESSLNPRSGPRGSHKSDKIRAWVDAHGTKFRVKDLRSAFPTFSPKVIEQQMTRMQARGQIKVAGSFSEGKSHGNVYEAVTP